MSGPIRARSSPSAVRSAGRALRGRTTCVSTDVVNACGGEGDGVSTILPQRSLLHNRRNTLQLVKGGHVFKMVNVKQNFDVTPPITIGTSLLLRNSIRAFIINTARMGYCNVLLILRMLQFGFCKIAILDSK